MTEELVGAVDEVNNHLGRSGKNSGELMSSNGFVSIFLKKSEGENILLSRDRYFHRG